MSGGANSGLSNDKLADLRVAHLNMIQGAVTRMSGFSANAKTFCVTILAAIIALAVQTGTIKLSLGAIVAVICLGFLDLYYLTLELRFRSEYERVAMRPLTDAADLRIKPSKFTVACLKKALSSLSIVLFYVPILLACTAAFVYATCYERDISGPMAGKPGGSAIGAERQRNSARSANKPDLAHQPAGEAV